ncbi:MAG: hypothetical protein HQL88_10635, partial [Magnetococcales bacterium]|nr:hypothetical protein [Magnetococcales bacterium]
MIQAGSPGLLPEGEEGAEAEEDGEGWQDPTTAPESQIRALQRQRQRQSLRSRRAAQRKR